MSSTDDCQDPFCTYCVGLPPSPTSSRIRIPITNLPQQKSIPLILRNNDSTPGIVHIPTPNITDYTPSHYSKTNKPSDKVFGYANPVRLGVHTPPGFMVKPPPRKDVKIVPDYLPAGENLREQNQRWWERTQTLVDKKRNKRAGDAAAAPRKTEKEVCGKEEGERDRGEGRSEEKSDSGVEVAISFV